MKFKIVLLGEGRVGKTSLTCRYINGVYNDNSLTTVQATFLQKNLVVDGKPIELEVWDTAGQERYHALGSLYYRDADGALLVYDVTHKESFSRVKHWVKELRKIVGLKICIAIAGNKSDLERHRTVDHKNAVEYASSLHAMHVLTSAKNNTGVEDIFLQLTKELISKREASSYIDDSRLLTSSNKRNRSSMRGSSRKLIIVDEDDDSTKKGCCG